MHANPLPVQTAPTSRPVLALFDLDHTLLAADTNELWLALLASEGLIDGPDVLARQARYLADYVGGRLDILAYMAFQLEPLAGKRVESLLPLRAQFAAEYLAPRIAPAAPALVARHRANGDTCAIVSATHRFLVEPSAQQVGIDELICTEIEIVDGRFSGRVAGIPCFRERKIDCVQDWLARRGTAADALAEAWFYSDSANDLPLLEHVGRPVAVDPDARLAQAAAERGWPTITLLDAQLCAETGR